MATTKIKNFKNSNSRYNPTNIELTASPKIQSENLQREPTSTEKPPPILRRRKKRRKRLKRTATTLILHNKKEEEKSKIYIS
jgi:hypothetical protein